MELILFLASVLGLVAAVIGVLDTTGRRRLGWCLIAAAFVWILFGEIVLLVTGSTDFIVRWVRGVPVRVLVVSGLWLLVWRGWRRWRW